jgi:hypothetical protein
MVQGDLEEESIKKPLHSITKCLCVFDRKEGISKLIRTNFENIRHKFDVWHSARSLAKKL